MACSSLEDVEAILEVATEDELQALSEEQKEAIEQYLATLVSEPPEELLPDAEKLRDSFMKMQSQAEIENFILGLSEAEQEALVEILSEEDIRLVAEQCGLLLDEVVHTPAKNYTNVGPLMPPFEASHRKGTMSPLGADKSRGNGLELSKIAVPKGDGSYTITLEAYTTGIVTSSEVSVPTDIVLVLDESGSMSDSMYSYTKVYSLDHSETYYVRRGNSFVAVKWCTGGLFHSHDPGWYTGSHFLWHWGTRYEPMTSESDTTSDHVQFYTRSATSTQKMAALKAAASKFVQSVYDDATTNDVDHRIAVVGFSNVNATSIKIGLKNDIRTQKAAVDSAIDNLSTGGSTYIEEGMTKAKDAFDNAETPTEAGPRNRVVIIFTDGIPGSGTWNNTTINNSANPAISTSKTLKNSPYGATVYTIGLLDGADPELPISDESNNDARTNKFLHYLSSNFPNAGSMTNAGSGGGIGGGYYLSASDAESLEVIFEKIAQEIATPSIELKEGTVVDVISPYFSIPADASAISLYTAAYDGSNFGERKPANGVVASIDGDKISVSGFDFDENFVSETGRGTPLFYGKKLIIEFSTSPKAGFLGGNAVPTNGAGSGIYSGDKIVESFDIPTVNVPMPTVIDVTAADKNIYLTGTLSDAQLLAGATASAGTEVNKVDFILFTGATEFVLPGEEDAWKSEFVKLTTELIRKGEETDTTQYMSDSEYWIKVTLAPTEPIEGGVPDQNTTSARGKINVFKPELTFKDSDVWYGDNAPANPADYDQNNKVTELWKHDATVSTDVTTMLGTKPTLALTYTPEAGSIKNSKIATKQDIKVKLDVKIGDSDITTYTSFVHLACGPACGWTDPTVPGDPAFLLHVKTATLTITKVGGVAGEPYVFKILKDGDTYTEVTIVGNNSVTIHELPVGKYSIVEDVNWSWRYGGSGFESDILFTKDNAEGTITCTNSLQKTNWLNAFSKLVRNIFTTP
jgi:hypothetical protein